MAWKRPVMGALDNAKMALKGNERACLAAIIAGVVFGYFGVARLQAENALLPPALAPVTVPGAVVHYQLPLDGPLPKTYRVTVAVVDQKNPNWIISTFAAGVVRTVTAENKGEFTETWDGLDDNHMPVPPGTYGLKGIYMPSQIWPIDGLAHTIIPKFVSAGSSWGQAPSQDNLPGKIEGDPCGNPLADVDVSPSGKGVIYFQYLENGTNYFLTDFTKPIGYDQIISGYGSGVFAGGPVTCTDGEVIWSFSTDGGAKFVGRADGKPFGNHNANRHNVFLPEGWVLSLAAWPDKQLGHSVVFAVEGASIEQKTQLPSKTEFVNEVLALDGNDAHLLTRWKLSSPMAVAARYGKLYLLNGTDQGFDVLSVPLNPGWQQTQPKLLFHVPPGITPCDLEADSHGRIYLSDSKANHVYQFDAQGNKLLTYGRFNAQQEGTYDPETFMAPEKLACWTDAQGQDRLLVVEMAGPNRLSEWSGDSGKMIRQWAVPQTRANDGYAVDPRQVDEIYVPGQRNVMTRWKVNYATGQWTPDAVWPNFQPGDSYGKMLSQLGGPQLIYRGKEVYMVFRRGYMVFHLEGEHWRACAGLLRPAGRGEPVCIWSDLNGDGQLQDEEYLPFQTKQPPGTLRYFGEAWLQDISLVCMGKGTPFIWQLPPQSFDFRGTPMFAPNGWRKFLTDWIFVDKAAGKTTTLHGGNEAASSYSSDWASVTQSTNGDVYVSARSGTDFTANAGAQYKLSRYIPTSRGYVELWRVGRVAYNGNAQPGEVYSPIFVSPPVNGLVGVVDNSRTGFVIYNEDGLYVDTLFPDPRGMTHKQMGAYWQPGEYFAGYDYVDPATGKIYLALGKTMPMLYGIEGWSMTENPVKKLATLDATIKIKVSQISSPPEQALQVRGGSAAARMARIYPATGGAPALDGSMRGWETCDPVQFGPDKKQSVEVRCYYDPEHLYLRWHVRSGHPFEPHPLGAPQHIFAHDSGNETVGLYLQGDDNATDATAGGRKGDVRFIFGIFKDGEKTRSVVVGMYPSWSKSGGVPQTYTTPVGSVTFAHVGIVPGVESGYKVDPDGEGFVLAASIPRTAIPGEPVFNQWRTEGNFDANLGGMDRFWWSNADGSASRDTFDEPTEASFYPGSWSVLQWMPVAPLSIKSWMVIGPFGFPKLPSLDVRAGRMEIIKTLCWSVFPPDTTRDMEAVYEGDITRTRIAQRRVTWREVTMSSKLVNFKKALDWAGYDDEGTAYLLTHIYAPEPVTVGLNLAEPYGLSFVGGQLNRVALPQNKDKGKAQGARPDLSKQLALKAGWNELLIRFDHIYGDNTVGADLVADPAVLWKLKISAQPPVGP